VLVVVIAVGGVAVTVVLVVDMICVSEGLVPALWPVSVLMPGVGQVRQRVLVVMACVLGVGMALMNVVDVTLALHAGVPAAGPVVVVVFGMNFVPGGRHGSSLLW
jgi:hypothetical protein